MQGFLYFRQPGTSAWISGYCAINASNGTLLYQAKGDFNLAKTLVSDLHGCHVRTFYDHECSASCLNVSTSSSSPGVQIRPHLEETFDSWLAALLCWQPIRRGDAHNVLPRPLPAYPELLTEKKGAFETSGAKDGAIIKVGKMLLWDRQAVGVSESRPTKKYTKKSDRSPASAWRRVDCSLQENGLVRIFTESEVTVLHYIQLNRLWRHAIQRLDPSVLQDEHCIAIYPQHTHPPCDNGKYIPPIYLSLETRVLFEVWFVLLRAFTIPSLYGPGSCSSGPGAGDDSNNGVSSSMADMFRIERQLALRLVDARLCPSVLVPAFREQQSTDSSWKKLASKPQTPTNRPQQPPGEYYSEVLLDGEIRAKTAVKLETHTSWREEFHFTDLSPTLSKMSIVVKTLIPGSRECGQTQSKQISSGQDECQSPFGVTCGKVDVYLDELVPGEEKETWWPIFDDNEQKVGETLMRVQLEETIVLASQDYEPLSELLHQFSNGVTGQVSLLIPNQLNSLAETLLDIYQVSGGATEWIMSLVEDEIDGDDQGLLLSGTFDEIAKEQRELIIRERDKSTVAANLLFRGNTLLTKSLDKHMHRLGQHYLTETLSAKLQHIIDADPDCEVDPVRISRIEDLERNWSNLRMLTTTLWASIYHSADQCPAELRHIFRHIRACAENRYGDLLRSVQYSSVSGFLFLRFFGPAILNPRKFGLLSGKIPFAHNSRSERIMLMLLLENPSPKSLRTFTLITKGLQGLANMTNFGTKETWMEPMNKFILAHRSEFKEYIDAICAIPPDRSAPPLNPSYSAPLQILRRLPQTWREGFPSLPYLIDQSQSFALLVSLWCETAPCDIESNPDIKPVVLRFHNLCMELHRKSIESIHRAEDAELVSNDKPESESGADESSGDLKKADLTLDNGEEKEDDVTPSADMSTSQQRASLEGYFGAARDNGNGGRRSFSGPHSVQSGAGDDVQSVNSERSAISPVGAPATMSIGSDGSYNTRGLPESNAAQFISTTISSDNSETGAPSSPRHESKGRQDSVSREPSSTKSRFLKLAFRRS